jgi:hypothetical protein
MKLQKYACVLHHVWLSSLLLETEEWWLGTRCVCVYIVTPRPTAMQQPQNKQLENDLQTATGNSVFCVVCAEML